MSEKKPFLIVAPNVLLTGGMDRANLAVAEYAAQLGVEVHIVAYKVHAKLLELPNVTHHPVKRILNSDTLSEPMIDHTGRRIARSIMQRGGRVMVNGGNCRWNDVNWVNHVHSADGAFPPPMLFQKVKRHIDYSMAVFNEKRFVQLAHTIITSCETTKADIIKHFKIPPEKVFTIYLGMNVDLFKPISQEKRAEIRQKSGWGQNQPLAIFVGALGNRRKGFDTLYAAWKSLTQSGNWDAKLLVVGRGADVAYWKQRIAEEGLNESIEMLGFIENLAEVVAATDISIMPSRYEGYSLAAQEAIVTGVPAIVTSKVGFAERYPESLKHLVLKDPDDVAGLCGIIRNWRDKMQESREAVKPFTESIRGYSWRDMAADMWELIQKRPAPTTLP